jgi:hypothetical protein
MDWTFKERTNATQYWWGTPLSSANFKDQEGVGSIALRKILEKQVARVQGK